MKNHRNNLLFYEGDLSATLDKFFEKISVAISNIDVTDFARDSDEEITRNIYTQFAITPLSLNEDEISMDQSETDIDVSKDWSRNVFNEGGPIYIKGTTVSISIPYTGTDLLWKLKPNQWQSFPRGEIQTEANGGKGTLVMKYQQPADQNPKDMKNRFDQDLKTVKFYISAQQSQIENEHNRLRDRIIKEIDKRRNVLDSQSSIANVFGIPASKPKSSESSTNNPKHSVPSAPSSEAEEWDLFICHASEDKDGFVRPLAELLQESGIKVWYDEFKMTVGDSLRQSIDKGLAKSRYGVVVISHNFLRKKWPQQELNGLFAKEVAGSKVILPVWYDIGHDEVTKYSPILADKLATTSESGIKKVATDLIDAIS